jgi:hypothetical protein
VSGARGARLGVATLALPILLLAGCASPGEGVRPSPSVLPGQPAPGVAASHQDAAGPSASGSAASSQLRLLVRDGDLRVSGSDCAGGGGYDYLHHTARFALTAPEGTALAHGTLPAGRAVPALSENTGDARVVPTYCEFDLVVAVPPADGYRLLLRDGPPVSLRRVGRVLAGEVP